MTSARIKIIACATVIEEMLPLLSPEMTYEVLDFGLHLHPGNLRATLQKAIDAAGSQAGIIILGYGLCSMAVVGLKATDCTLVVPRVDDCIAIFLGSHAAYKEQAGKEPGTYYLTKGWIEVGDTPFAEYQRLVERYGQERAGRMIRLMLKNYTRLALIDTGQYEQERYRDYAHREAGQATMEWISAVGPIDGESIATLGLPNIIGSFSKAPFDILGDTMRGTRPIMMDMYRRPAKLIEAMERIVPIAVEMGLRYATASDTPMVFIPLHKGADGFMSNGDFEKFYWPTLKAVLLGLIDEGAVPYLFVEGGYNQRLDILASADIPAGHTIWLFDQTNMKEVKKKMGGWACFGGNVPGSLLKAGTPQDVKNYVKKLIDEVAQDGGYILANGAVLDDATPANLHAMIDTGKTYGVY